MAREHDNPQVAWRMHEAHVKSKVVIGASAGAVAMDVGNLTLSPQKCGNAMWVKNRPRPNLTAPKERQYPRLSDKTVLFVGAGAGTLFAACYLLKRGAKPENITNDIKID